MIAFGDTDFLQGVPRPMMVEFLQLYHKHIRLPFTMQASVETLLDTRILGLLQAAQCCAISVGVESGSDRIRKSIIKKSVPVEVFRELLNSVGILI